MIRLKFVVLSEKSLKNKRRENKEEGKKKLNTRLDRKTENSCSQHQNLSHIKSKAIQNPVHVHASVVFG